jgi:tetratricopeptide (TPR) repeat protein
MRRTHERDPGAKVRRRSERAIAAGVVALLAWAAPPVARGDVDTGVIRLAQPSPAPDEDAPTTAAIQPRADARHGFDVEAFDSRFESLWFQRKAYLASGRDEDVARQSDLIRDFVAEEEVRRLDVPAGALLIESLGWLREGNHDKALASLALAESLDPGRPQIALARARVLWASGAGSFAAASEWLRAMRGLVAAALRDLSLLNGLALAAVVATLAVAAVFALLMTVRHQVALRHDVEEWLIRADRESWAKAGGWAVLLLPFVLWVGAGWVTIYWLAAFFRYMRRSERAVAALLLVAAALAVPAYRISIGLYGVAADPTVRTTIAAANGGYDPDRIVKVRQLVDAHPDDPMYRFLLAGLYKNGRYFEEAFQEYKRVLDAAPSTYQARINLGNIYFLLGQYGEAMSNYRKALDLRPTSALAYYDMYLAQSDSFKLKEATESLAQARNLDPAQTNRWLTSGSREGGGPKVIDAMIDFDSIFRAAVEGRRLRQWFEGEPERRPWTAALADLTNATSLLALAGLLSCGITLVTLRGRAPAQRCTRCGRPFCSYCKSEREGHEFCSQCAHLFVLGDGLAPETKSMKLYEVERHAARGRRGRRLASAILPGASHVLSGRAWVGCGLLTLWLFAWIGGFPRAMAPAERFFGLGVHLAELRLGSIPDVYSVDAVFVLALPLAVAVWFAGNAGSAKMRGA